MGGDSKERTVKLTEQDEADVSDHFIPLITFSLKNSEKSSRNTKTTLRMVRSRRDSAPISFAVVFLPSSVLVWS